jgi:outer membrane protein OmpU
MKKVLLATTALVLSAGVASAEISLSGGGYVGVAGTTSDLSYNSRFDLTVDGSIESESGISVSARTRIRTSNGATAVASTPRINVSVGAVTLSFGNTDSAIRARSNPWASCVGNLGDDCGGSVFGTGFSSDGGAGADRVRLDYTSGDFTVSASSGFSNQDVEVGVSAAMSGINLNLGYNVDSAAYALDVNGTVGSVNAGLRYDDAGDAADALATLYGNTTMGATSVGVYLTNGASNTWGFGVSHDLGGGVAAGAALADGDIARAHISFSF